MTRKKSSDKYRKHIRRKIALFWAATALLPIVFLYSLSVGPVDVTWAEIVHALLYWDTSDAASNVVIEWRIPPALAAMLAGAGLAVSGAVMQAVLRNPLCSPFTLGISGAAAFGAALTVFLFAGDAATGSAATVDHAMSRPVMSVTTGAFLSSLLATFLVLALSGRRAIRPETMILIGVALSSFYGAGIMLLQYLADEQQLAAMLYWSFGDTQRASWNSLGVMTLVVVVSSAFFLLQNWNYNALSLGEETAVGLGVPVRRIRFLTMFFASLSTAVLVSSLGIIGFVGLVVPHLARLLIGSDNRFVVPFSLVFGALLLLLSDTLARQILPGRLLPVSIVTAFLGAPIFLMMLLRRKET